MGAGRRVGGLVGAAVGVQQVGDGTGRVDGVFTSIGVTVGRADVAAGPPWTTARVSALLLRAIAVPATATPTTAAAASPPSRIRVVRRFRPTSFIVALRTYVMFGQAEGRHRPAKWFC
ncbi:hypothetical protein [Kribbella sp. NPDC004536]|uniref:hypothetical protein n=1 Tax=Kribbella sp. NPDC004536 TaxID=3364106 RepID=UPI00367AD619